MGARRSELVHFTPSITIWRKMYEFRWSGLSRIPGFRGTVQIRGFVYEHQDGSDCAKLDAEPRVKLPLSSGDQGRVLHRRLAGRRFVVLRINHENNGTGLRLLASRCAGRL